MFGPAFHFELNTMCIIFSSLYITFEANMLYFIHLLQDGSDFWPFGDLAFEILQNCCSNCLQSAASMLLLSNSEAY